MVHTLLAQDGAAGRRHAFLYALFWRAQGVIALCNIHHPAFICACTPRIVFCLAMVVTGSQSAYGRGIPWLTVVNVPL